MDPDPRPLPSAAADAEEGLPAAIELAEPVYLGQPWEPVPFAAPAAVRIAWCPSAVLVRADLTDDAVHTAAAGDFESFWELGDVFEIFLEAGGSGFYTEMHVAPGNLRMHLRLGPDDIVAIRAGRLDRQARMVRPPGFQSLCRLVPGGWQVEALIPAGAVDPGARLTSSSVWKASFCRYDAWPDGRKPVLSSTSLHRWPINFHKRSDWRPICF